MIQLGVESPRAPGRPDIRTTVGTSRSLANVMVFRTTLSCSGPSTGCNWLPLAHSALNVSPRDEIFSANSARASAEETRVGRSACGASDQLPVATSTELSPWSLARSRALSKGRWPTESVIRPIFI